MTEEKIKVEGTPEDKIAEIDKYLEVSIMPRAEKIVIKKAEDVIIASEFVVDLKKTIKRIESVVSFFTDPYVEQRRIALVNKNNIEAMFAPKLTPLIALETKIKRGISDYRLAEDLRIAKEEERKQKIRDEANLKREEQGKEKIETPIVVAKAVEQTIRSEDGRATTKKSWKYEVVDINLVPREYLRCEIKNAEVIGAIKTNGVREIVGLRIYEDYDVSVTAR